MVKVLKEQKKHENDENAYIASGLELSLTYFSNDQLVKIYEENKQNDTLMNEHRGYLIDSLKENIQKIN